MKPLLVLAAFPMVLMGWASCSHSGTGHAALPDPRAVDKSVPEYKNPFHPSTYAHFVARKDYRKTYDVYKDDTLLNRQPKKSRKIFVCLDEQRGQYLVDGLVAMDFPLSSGVKAYPTKTGDYAVISKKEDHTSNLYGKMYDAEGKCINYNAESTDPVPEGGRFDGSPMPYWQRLTNAGLGLHVGKVRRHPVSHGCVRLPRNVAEILYRQTSIGTPVTIRKTPLPVPEAQKVPASTSTVRTAILRSQAAPTNIPGNATRHRTAAFRRTGRHLLRMSQCSLKLRSLLCAAMYAARKAAVSSRSWTVSMNMMTSVGMHLLRRDSPAPMSALCAV